VSALAGLVQQGHCILGEELALAAGPLETVAQVVGRVTGRHRVDAQPVVQA
jgi:hypothetical protein